MKSPFATVDLSYAATARQVKEAIEALSKIDVNPLAAAVDIHDGPAAPAAAKKTSVKKGFFGETRLARGTKVKIQGLKARPELNGCCATVTAS